MKQVRLDDDVIEELKKRGYAGESFNKVLRRLFKIDERGNEDEAFNTGADQKTSQG